MNIMDELRLTDELRRFANEWDWLDYKADDSARKLRAIADRIDAEHERMVGCTADEWDYWESTHIELPKDADDECIYVGDMMDGYGKTIEVVELRIGRSGWVVVSRDGNAYADTFAFVHHKPPTVDDVLREMLTGMGVDADEHCADADAYIAEYAAKLRLLKESE